MIPNYIRLDFLAARAKRTDWSDEDAQEILDSIQWAYTRGTNDDIENCRLWLKLEAGKVYVRPV